MDIHPPEVLDAQARDVDPFHRSRGGIQDLAGSVEIMPFKIKLPFGRQDTIDASTAEQAHSPVAVESATVDAKGTPIAPAAIGATGDAWKEGIDEDAQLGVKKAQATTLTWSKAAVYTTLSW